MPRKFKKRRMMTGTNGEGMGWEEYYDYQFPDDESKPANLKILEMAQMWKQKAAATGDEEAGLAALKLGAGGGAPRDGGEADDEERAEGVGTKRKLGGGTGVAGEGDGEEIELDEFEDDGDKEEGPESSKRKLNEAGEGHDPVKVDDGVRGEDDGEEAEEKDEDGEGKGKQDKEYDDDGN